ncbi:hypothetical protein [Microbulbifer mangrovi]|uniref:hypothetical protein n=1 Tax=Microbulbifer mangrovi TaxID=927787 RepID=UPI000990632F|nr:hypothetical protein [Microbulbifer mangrovi]
MNYSDWKRRYSRATTDELMYLYVRGGLLPEATRALEEILCNRTDFSGEELELLKRDIRVHSKREKSSTSFQTIPPSNGEKKKGTKGSFNKIYSIFLGLALASLLIPVGRLVFFILEDPHTLQCQFASYLLRSGNEEQREQWCSRIDKTPEEEVSSGDGKYGVLSGDREAISISEDVVYQSKIVGKWSCEYYFIEDGVRVRATESAEYFAGGRADSAGNVMYQSDSIIPFDFEFKQSHQWSIKGGRLTEVTDAFEMYPASSWSQNDISMDIDSLDPDDLVETYEILELSETALVLRAESDGVEHGCSKAIAGGGRERKIQGIPAPITLGGFTSAPPVDIESSKHDRVTRLPYSSPGIKITVAIYDVGYQYLPDGSGSELALIELKSLISEANDNLRAGDGDNVKISEVVPMGLTPENANFLGRRLDFPSDDGAISHHLFLTVFNNKFLKVVATSSSRPGSTERVHAFVMAYTRILWPNPDVI